MSPSRRLIESTLGVLLIPNGSAPCLRNFSARPNSQTDTGNLELGPSHDNLHRGLAIPPFPHDASTSSLLQLSGESFTLDFSRRHAFTGRPRPQTQDRGEKHSVCLRESQRERERNRKLAGTHQIRQRSRLLIKSTQYGDARSSDLESPLPPPPNVHRLQAMHSKPTSQNRTFSACSNPIRPRCPNIPHPHRT